jgi:hypothetical protein
MNDFATVLLVLALPPAAVVFLALVWAKGWLRIGLATAVVLVPVGIFVWLLATAGHRGDSFAALGFASLAVVLLAGAVTGAILGGLVVLVRNVRRKRVETSPSPANDIP